MTTDPYAESDTWPVPARAATHSPDEAQEAPEAVRAAQEAREAKWAEALDGSTKNCPHRSTFLICFRCEVDTAMALADEENATLRAERDQARAEAERLRMILEGGESAEGAMRAVREVVAIAARAEVAEAALARVKAEVPDECWVSRSTEVHCTDFIGGKLGSGEFTHTMCCLPCRVRAALAAEPTPAAAPHAEDGV